MGTEPIAPGNLPQPEVDPPSASQSTYARYLEKREYDRLATLLENSTAAYKTEEQPVVYSLTTAAQGLCRACLDCREQEAHHQQLRDTAVTRENDLRADLERLLGLLGEVDGRGPQVAEKEPAFGQTGERSPGFWKRIQMILGIVQTTEAQSSDDDTKDNTKSVATDESVSGTDTNRSAPPQANIVEPTIDIEEFSGPSLAIHCLGVFQAYHNDQPIEEWPSGKGKSILKYLTIHHTRAVQKEVLMDLFWPNLAPEAARNNLNVAIYGLRQALGKVYPDYSHILFRDGTYALNPEMRVWVDIESFWERLTHAKQLEQKGALTEALRQYRGAEELYQGEFMEEDRYEDWVLPIRQEARNDYIEILEYLSQYYDSVYDNDSCATICRKLITIEPCQESAHRRLMRSYARQGLHHLALRQYHRCVEALKNDLDLTPSERTTKLYNLIRRRHTV